MHVSMLVLQNTLSEMKRGEEGAYDHYISTAEPHGSVLVPC